MIDKPFSRQLEEWLESRKPKTLQGLIDNFSEKSFALLFLLLMAIPALPLPTGGITHIFEIIAMLLALELMVGRRDVWLPQKWRSLNLPARLRKSTLPYLIKIMRRLERIPTLRFQGIFRNRLVTGFIGLFIFVFCLFAFLAPPFSGLDTLPSLGVVIISLAIIMDDSIIFLAGLVVGSIGIGLVIALGKLIFSVV